MSKSTVHVFTADHQPATRYAVEFGTFKVIDELAIRAYIPASHVFRHSPRHTFYATCCGERRWAKHLTTQVYYDAQTFWCRKGHGCKA